MESNLLTIIIPTYNRGEILKENLAYLLPLIRPYSDKISVYVSDNASTDRTQKYVENFMLEFSGFLCYYRHETNIGAQANFKHAVHNVQSKYVCLLGDEDIVMPHYPSIILSTLEKHPDVGLIHYNFVAGSLKMNGSYLFYPNFGHVHGEDFFCTEYKNGRDFLKEKLDGPSLISSNVFKRELWEKAVCKEMDIPGYLWFSILCYAILDAPCIFFHHPLLYQRFSGIGGYSDKWLLYYFNGQGSLFKTLSSEIPDIYDKWTNNGLCDQHKDIQSWIMQANSNRKFYKEHYFDVLQHLVRKKDRWLFWMSVSLPSFIFRRTVLRYIVIKKKLQR